MSRMLLKLDVARAFDSVAWPFLLDTLRHLGFGNRWCEWISILPSTTSTRVLVNGIPGPPILHACGLRQGDSISPMLFVIVIDMLNSLLQRAVEHGRAWRAMPSELGLGVSPHLPRRHGDSRPAARWRRPAHLMALAPAYRCFTPLESTAPPPWPCGLTDF